MARPSIAESLARTESGGNYQADNGLGYFGKYQFGEARLKDLGLGAVFTMDQYRNDPQVQEWVFNKHVEDIDRFIADQGLDKFYGQNVNGVPLTREGMIAVAHLGGKGGLQKFVTTGGKYNPSDAFGTSLTDYARTHGTAAAIQSQGESAAPRPNDPQPRQNPLVDFASDMKAGSEQMTGILSRFDPENKAAPQGPQQGMTLPMGQGPAPIAPAQALSFGPNVGPVNTGPFAPPSPLTFGQPPVVPGGTPTPAGTPPGFGITPTPAVPFQPPQVTQSGNDPVGPIQVNPEEGEPERTPFMQRIAEFFYPNQEDPLSKFKETLGGIGVGLGQMSAGQAVDLQPYFNRIAQQRQGVIDAYNEQIAQELDLRRVQNDEARLDLDMAKQSLELAKFNVENSAGGGMFTPEQLEAYANDPVTARFVAGLGSPDKDTREAAMDSLMKVEQARAEQLIAGSPQLGELYDAVANDAPPAEIARILSEGNVDASDLNTVMSALGKNPTAFMKDADALRWAKRNDPELYDQMIARGRMESGIDETPREKSNRLYAETTMDNMRAGLLTNRQTDFRLGEIERLTKDMIEGRIESSVFDNAILTVNSALRGVVGGEWANSVGEKLGLGTDVVTQLEQLQGAEAGLALMIAGSMMEGQGQVSDGERALMLTSIARGNTTNETRLMMVNRLRVLNQMDAIAARQYRERLNDDFSNSRTLHDGILESGSEAANEISRALDGYTAVTYSGMAPGFAAYSNMSSEEKYFATAPMLTQEQFDLYKDVLPKDTEGRTAWQRINPDGSFTYLLGELELEF